jgi:hypothetical protein
MTRTFLSLTFAAALLAVLPTSPAGAVNARSYVSGKGSGVACTLAAPCAALQTAQDATIPGGEVYCLDGGVSDAIVGLSIDRSITIDCHGSVSWVILNEPGITVLLRNLTITSFNQLGISGVGVDFQNGAALTLENCVVENWNNLSAANPPGIGIRVAPLNGTVAKLHVIDTLIRGNGLPGSGGGIVIEPFGPGSARVVIEHSRVENNTSGIVANGTGSTGLISVHVRDSVVANNVLSGISAITSAGHSTTAVVVDRSSSLLNGANGILSQGVNAFMLLKESTVLSNVTGLSAVSGGTIFSYQNNGLSGNVSDGAPTAVLTVK